MAYAKNTKSVRVVPLTKESYIAMIEAASGSKLFRRFFCTVNGRKMEVLRDGKLGCAFFVTAILKIFSLAAEVQITVHRALDELARSGWRITKKPKKGDIVVWGELPNTSNTGKEYEKFYLGKHKHIGFYLGNGRAVSNVGEKKMPTITSVRYRPLAYFLTHERLAGKK